MASLRLVADALVGSTSRGAQCDRPLDNAHLRRVSADCGELRNRGLTAHLDVQRLAAESSWGRSAVRLSEGKRRLSSNPPTIRPETCRARAQPYRNAEP